MPSVIMPNAVFPTVVASVKRLKPERKEKMHSIGFQLRVVENDEDAASRIRETLNEKCEVKLISLSTKAELNAPTFVHRDIYHRRRRRRR